MARAMHLVFIVLFMCSCFSLMAQDGSEKQAKIGDTKNSQTSDKTGLATMSEGTTPETTEGVDDLENRIVRIGENLNLSIAETVDSIILLGGDAKIYGKVKGDVFVFKGNVEVKSGAAVGGRVTTVLGKITGKKHLEDATQPRLKPYAEINGWRLAPALISVMMEGIPQKAWKSRSLWFVWELVTFLTLTITHVLLVVAFPQRMADMAHAVSNHPGKSTVLGIGIMVLVPFMSILLILSIVGLPVMLLLCALLVVMAIYGRTAILPQRSSVVATVIGYWLYRMATVIPHLNVLTFTIASAIGIGICMRALMTPKTAPHATRSYRRTTPTWRDTRRL